MWGTDARKAWRRSDADAVQGPLAAYLGEVSVTPLLTAEEEKQLASRIGAGDLTARDHMVRANLRLVVRIARRYPGQGVSLEDLIAEGNLGLLRAVERFNPALNTRFSTYASFWIKQSMRRAVINTGKTIRIPAYMNQLLVEWRRAAAKLRDKLGREPAPEEVADFLHLSRRRLNVVQKAIRIHNAVPQRDEAEDHRIMDETLMDKQALPPDSVLARREEVERALRHLDRLEPREAAVLRLRFGLEGAEPKTLRQVGGHLGLTRERVRQIQIAALRQLSDLLAAK